MKKSVAFIVLLLFVIGIPATSLALLLFVIGIPATSLAINGEYSNAAQNCKANDNLGYSSLGKCISVLRACDGLGNTEAVCTCKEFLNSAPVGFFDTYNNTAECINFQRHGYVFE
jgi:hypothetical protein